ncbi:MAG: metal-sulfur cluster assembly factor [Rickettsiales bacterium]|jgi:metal-sulfur cluster biosynthetic enzyme|nr:metal-sulfur cluster assembly factor [Rickettsiales bacterium]
MITDKIILDGDIVELPDITATAGNPLSAGQKPLRDKETIIEAIKLVLDPDVHIDVYNLGLIYSIDLLDNGDVMIDMTLTSPTCPMAEEMPQMVADSVARLGGVGRVEARLVWSPAWTLSMLSDEAKYQLEIGDLEL